MALDQNQIQFAMSTPSAPALDKAMEGLGKGFNGMMNSIVEKAGDCIGACHKAVAGLGKASIADVGKTELAGAIGSADIKSLSPSPSPQGQSKGQERSPEITQQIKKSVGAMDIAIAKGGEHVPDGTMVCPACTPTMGFAMGQGMARA